MGPELVQTFKTIKEYELERFRVSNQEYVRRNRRLITLQGFFFPSMSFFLGLGSLLVLWLGSREVIRGRITLGEFVAFNGYLVMLSWPMIAFGWVTNMLQRGMASWKRMLEVLVEIDGRPLSRWGCDGVVCATPTGSTAYAFSAGGPVVWPEVEALLMVPISAHALFAPPMVLSPRSVLAVELIAGHETSGAVLWCDGRRKVDLPPGARVEVRRGALPVLLARLHGPGPAGFTDRLVAKFGLPVAGWRGRTREDAGEHA